MLLCIERRISPKTESVIDSRDRAQLGRGSEQAEPGPVGKCLAGQNEASFSFQNAVMFIRFSFS